MSRRDQQRLADYLGHILQAIERIERYTEEELRRRVIDELRPQHKTAKVTGKKKPDAKKEKRKEQDKRKAAEAEEPRKKERLRDKKNKGKPDWAKKKAAKEAAGGVHQVDARQVFVGR